MTIDQCYCCIMFTREDLKGNAYNVVLRGMDKVDVLNFAYSTTLYID